MLTLLWGSWRWLCQEGPSAKKHQGWQHPFVVVVLHYVIAISVSIAVHDALLGTPLSIPMPSNNNSNDAANNSTTTTMRMAQGLIVYLLWLLLWRLLVVRQPPFNTAAVWYEMTWLCNLTMLMGALALVTQRPLLALAYSFTVGIDQLLWYVDLSGYFLHRLIAPTTASPWFPIGVAKYLTWPEATWKSRIGCTHHLWTIPILWTYATSMDVTNCATSSSSSSSNWTAQRCWYLWCLTLTVMTVNVLLSRFLTPAAIQTKYLNVNLSHALWKDINFAFLQIEYDSPPPWLYLFRLLWRWQCFNTIIMLGWWIWMQLAVLSRVQQN